MWGRDKPISDFDRQVERNLTGIELEKSGQVDEAILLYEANLRENCEGNHPYDRLAVIYRKRKQIDEEIRVLQKAIWVFDNVVYKWRGDRPPKLAQFKKRLARAKALKASAYRNS
jgi:tetratricopeptide (TPR) repeat protein